MPFSYLTIHSFTWFWVFLPVAVGSPGVLMHALRVPRRQGKHSEVRFFRCMLHGHSKEYRREYRSFQRLPPPSCRGRGKRALVGDVHMGAPRLGPQVPAGRCLWCVNAKSFSTVVVTGTPSPPAWLVIPPLCPVTL